MLESRGNKILRAAGVALPGVSGLVLASAPGTLDGPTLFNFVAITLVELAAIFWVGAQLWGNFVLQAATEKHQAEQDFHTRVEQRFARRFSLPALAIFLLANLGVLYGQVLTLTGDNWGAALSLQYLSAQARGGTFGVYWLLSTGAALLALLVGLFMPRGKEPPRFVAQTLPLLNLFLGAVLLIAIALSGNIPAATAVNARVVPFAVVLDWLHLLAAALWVGGLLSVSLVYLPLLKTRQQAERARSLLVLLPQFSLLVIAGMVIMAITGVLSALSHLAAPAQLTTTAYGRTLLVKIFLVGTLLVAGVYHIAWLLPRFKKEYQKYAYAQERLVKAQTGVAGSVVIETASGVTPAEPGDQQHPGQHKLLRQQVQLRAERLTHKTSLLTGLLGWEAWLGVAIVVCVGLLSVFSGTLTATATTPTGPQNGASSKPFTGTAQTTDGKYVITLNVNPDRFGANVITVHVTEAATGRQLDASQVTVAVYTTMLNMDMGTDNLELESDGQGGFRGTSNLFMGGDWNIQVQVRAPDKALHRVMFKIFVPF